MIKFNANIRVPQIDETRFIGALEKLIETAMVKAIRAFLLAAVPRVPIYTGFARGAFRNLEDRVGQVGKEGAGFRIRGTRRGSSNKSVAPRGRDRPRYYNGPPRVLKNQNTGRQFATPVGSVLTMVKGRISTSFKFAINIDYFDRLDREKWHSFEAGIAAFNQTLQAALRRSDFDIKSFIVRRQFT